MVGFLLIQSLLRAPAPTETPTVAVVVTRRPGPVNKPNKKIAASIEQISVGLAAAGLKLLGKVTDDPGCDGAACAARVGQSLQVDALITLGIDQNNEMTVFHLEGFASADGTRLSWRDFVLVPGNDHAAVASEARAFADFLRASWRPRRKSPETLPVAPPPPAPAVVPPMVQATPSPPSPGAEAAPSTVKVKELEAITPRDEAVTGPSAAQTVAPPSPNTLRRWLPFASGGVAAAAAVTAITLLAVGYTERSRLDAGINRGPDGMLESPLSYRDASTLAASANAKLTAGLVSAVLAGALGIASGIFFYLREPVQR